MKISFSKLAFVILLGFSIQSFAAEPKCPEECKNGCPRLCEKADDCGVGHKCVSDACGTHCEEDVAK